LGPREAGSARSAHAPVTGAASRCETRHLRCSRITERNEAAIARWKEVTWPVTKDGRPGRLPLLRRRLRPGLEAAHGPQLGLLRPHPSGTGDRHGQQARDAGRADRHQAMGPGPADLPHARRPRARQRPARGLHRTDHAHLLDAAHRQPGSSLVVVWDNRNTHVSRAMADAIAVREAAPFLGDAWFYRRSRTPAAANHA
jgi:hypothetical protein